MLCNLTPLDENIGSGGAHDLKHDPFTPIMSLAFETGDILKVNSVTSIMYGDSQSFQDTTS